MPSPMKERNTSKRELKLRKTLNYSFLLSLLIPFRLIRNHACRSRGLSPAGFCQ